MYRTIYLICETITIMIPHVSHLKIQTEAKIKVYRVETYDRYSTFFFIFNSFHSQFVIMPNLANGK